MVDDWLPLDLESQCMLIVIYQLNDTTTGTMTVLRPMTIKGQKAGGSPIPWNPHPFPKIVGITLPFISLWNYPPLQKLTTLYPSASPLLRWPKLYGVCISLNKPSFTLLWLALEFFPVWSQEPTLGGYPRDLDVTCDVTILSGPTFFPATLRNWIPVILQLRIRNIYLVPLSGTELLKPLEFLVLRLKKVSFVMLIRWLWKVRKGEGWLGCQDNQLIRELKLSVPSPDLWGGEKGWN